MGADSWSLRHGARVPGATSCVPLCPPQRGWAAPVAPAQLRAALGADTCEFLNCVVLPSPKLESVGWRAQIFFLFLASSSLEIRGIHFVLRKQLN